MNVGKRRGHVVRRFGRARRFQSERVAPAGFVGEAGVFTAAVQLDAEDGGEAGFVGEREGAQIVHAELVGVGGFEVGEQAFCLRDSVFRDWGKDDRDIQSMFLRACKKFREQRPVREQSRAAGVSDVYAPGGAGEGGQVRGGFALERIERQGKEAPVRREVVRRQRERPVSGQRKRGHSAQPRRFLLGKAARGRVRVGAAGEHVGEVFVVAQRLQAKIIRIQLQRPPRLLREGGTCHVHRA